MNTGDAINVLENSLRDVIERLLGSADEAAPADRLGIAKDRIEQWRSRREEESKRRVGGEVEGRLLYFSDFTDLAKIIEKNWDKGFKECFGDKKRFNVYMDRLGAFRNPDAHSRVLLPHEEQLLLGMSGELRQAVTLFLSSGAGGAEPEYFARIEEVRDNFGLRAPGRASGQAVQTSEVVLHPGDVVSFVGRAWDPEGGALEWVVGPMGGSGRSVSEKGSDLAWDWNVRDEDISDLAFVRFSLRSERPYSRLGELDDELVIGYRVLPTIRRSSNG